MLKHRGFIRTLLSIFLVLSACLLIVKNVSAKKPLAQNMTVTIVPPEAVEDGAQWREKGSVGPWLDSGDTTTYSTKRFKPEYKDTNYWITPKEKAIEGTEFTAEYTPNFINFDLTVNVDPPEVQAEAMWRLVGQEWRMSGETVNLAGGEYTIEFIDVPGWNTPVSQTIYVRDGTATVIAATYDSAEAFFGVTDVSWEELTDPFVVAGPVSSLNGIPILPSFLYSEFGGSISSSISFRLFSASEYVSLTVEIYTVIGDTMVEDKLVKTLLGPESVQLLPDAEVDNHFSRYFENFLSWDGLDTDGERLPPGLYKVKVTTDDDDNWDEEVAFTEDLRVIPRRYLRSPFTDPDRDYPIDSDLETGILSGLYPTYYSGGSPLTKSCDMQYRIKGDAIINSLIDQLITRGTLVPIDETIAREIIDELIADGNISPYGVPKFGTVDLDSPYEDYSDDVEAILSDPFLIWGSYWVNTDWKGQCLVVDWFSGGFPDEAYFLNGYPKYEGPISHGTFSEEGIIFEGKPAQLICRCGPDISEGCAYSFETTCYECGPDDDGKVCGIINFIEYWEDGSAVVEQDLIGYLHTPATGPYEFGLIGDDEATLTLGGTLDVVWTGDTPVASIEGGEPIGTADATNENYFQGPPPEPLSAGYHPIEVNFINTDGNASLRLLWNVKDANNQNFIFTDPTYIQETVEDENAFADFLSPSSDKMK